VRFPMRLDAWWAPLLAALLFATPNRAYVALDGDQVDVRFGLFRLRFPRAQVTLARRAPGHWGYGIGIHTNLVDSLIVNGSLAGLVELRLSPPKRVWLLFIPVRCARLFLSLENPDAFQAALGQPTSTPAR